MTPEQALELLRQINPDANHIAKDENHVVWWCSKKPIQSNNKWMNDYSASEDGYLGRTSTIEWPSENWKDCIVSHEEPITDEDACKRIQVMVRDANNWDWMGPFTLVAVLKSGGHRFLIINKVEHYTSFQFAKRVK